MKKSNEYSIRRNDLDWLRVIAIIVVFLYHSVHFFDTGDWSVKNSITYNWIESYLMNFMAVWMMPLIFLVSGASVFYAAKKSNALSFIKDKFLRLFVPLFVGVFSFSIMQVYLERISHNQFQGSFIDFIPHYFDGIYIPGGTGNFAVHGMHLWYLLFLFLFTLVFMPLFWWFKGKAGSVFLQRLGDVLAIPGFLILFLVPTVAIHNFMTNEGSMVIGGWRLSQYVWFFLAGYLIASNQKLQLQIVKSRWIYAFLSLGLISVSIVLHKGPANHEDILVWLELFTFIGFAMKYLNFSNAFLEYSREAVMPFYVLHQNVLLFVGFFVVNLNIPDLAKFLLIIISTLIVIIGVYEYLIRRYSIMRILFGMKMIVVKS